MSKTSETISEHTAIDWFSALGWHTDFGPDISMAFKEADTPPDRRPILRPSGHPLGPINPDAGTP